MTVIQVTASRIAPFYCILSKVHFIISFYINVKLYITSTVYQSLGYDILLTLLSVCVKLTDRKRSLSGENDHNTLWQ